MIAGGLGNVRRAHVAEGRGSRGRQARRARRAGDAHRPGRRRGVLDRQRRHRARIWISPRCSAAIPEIQRRAQEVIDHCWALGARQPHRADPRRRRRRAVQRGAGGGGAQRARRAHRPAHDPERRTGHVAAGALVQRGAGALRAGASRRRRCRNSQRHRGARALPVRGDRRDRRLRPAAWSRIRCSATSRSTCRIEVLLGKPPRMTRDVHSVAACRPALRHRHA